MSVFKIDSNNDIAIENNRFLLLDGPDAIGQNQKTNLKMYFGEWFLNTEEGVPWFQTILGKGSNPVVVDAVLKNAIASTPGTISIDDFTLDLDDATRELSLEYSATVQNGTVEFNEVVS